MFSNKKTPWAKYGLIQVMSNHQSCCRINYYRSMICIPYAHGQNKVCILNELRTIDQRVHTWSSDHLYVDDACTGSGPSWPAVTSCHVLFWITYNHCVNLQLWKGGCIRLSHQTHHQIPKQQSTKAEGEVGGGFDNRFDKTKKNWRKKENNINVISRKCLVVCDAIIWGK